ncbi:MAG: hypothetical protein DWQ04_22510 [Chloroflexi bacterium]|nr:MAG: hypothetical protein DWQ04_22510 [Chloroflexota bacterium]
MKEDRFVPKSDFADHPVNNVSWYGANAYYNWVKGQLPTEAQWEYAARGIDSRLYPWGITIPTCTIVTGPGRFGGSVEVGASFMNGRYLGVMSLIAIDKDGNHTGFTEYSKKSWGQMNRR